MNSLVKRNQKVVQ